MVGEIDFPDSQAVVEAILYRRNVISVWADADE
jgi:hypothetical protein